MGETLNIEDSEGIEEQEKSQATNAKAAGQAAATADIAAVKLTGGDRSIDEVIAKSKGDLIKIRKTIDEGGFSGAERDKYIMSLHHAEWIQARNIYIDCDNNVKNKSVKFTSLEKGKAQNHEIIAARTRAV